MYCCIAKWISIQNIHNVLVGFDLFYGMIFKFNGSSYYLKDEILNVQIKIIPNAQLTRQRIRDGRTTLQNQTPIRSRIIQIQT